MTDRFGHPDKTVFWWRKLAASALRAGATTPFYLFAPEPVAACLTELESLDFGLPVTHWYSCKTQPLPPMLKWWHAQGRPVEVVSEFEFLAARAAGLNRILVNGPAKHRWLPRHSTNGQLVHFDSPHELAALLPLAKKQQWQTGLRIRTQQEINPENPAFPTQFGLEPNEIPEAVRRLRKAGLEPGQIHFHLRTNVAHESIYTEAAEEALDAARQARWFPKVLDCGGGLPPPHTLTPEGKRYDASMRLPQFAAALRAIAAKTPGLEELWLENGRFLLASSGVLVIRILDLKERRGLRQLICDGGRTMNALISTWEQHLVTSMRRKLGPNLLTSVCGPTCMAFDQLAQGPLPAALKRGDPLLWFEAGAYHLPWETRFSHGLAEIWWSENRVLKRVRDAEPFESDQT